MRIFCSICKELFTLFSEVCITKCGHLYHVNCLKLWQERNPTCPQCRRQIIGNPGRVYFNTEDVQVDSESDVDSLKAKIENLVGTTGELENKNKQLKSSNTSLKNKLTKSGEIIKAHKLGIKQLEEEVNVLKKEKKDLLPLKMKNRQLKAELKHKSHLDIILNGTENEVREMLSKTPVTSLAVHQLCVYVEALKHQLRMYEEKYKSKNEAIDVLYKNTHAGIKQPLMNTEKHLSGNKAAKKLSDSNEKTEVCGGLNLKRSNTTSVNCLALNSDAANSSKILKPNPNQECEKRNGKSVKSIINNLGQPPKKDCPAPSSSDDEYKVFIGPGKVTMCKSSIAKENHIFEKLEYSARTGCENILRKKNALATSSQTEQMKGICMRPKSICLKNSTKILTPGPSCSSKN